MNHEIKLVSRKSIDEDDHCDVCYEVTHQLIQPIKTYYQSTKIKTTNNMCVSIILDVSEIYSTIPQTQKSKRDCIIQAFEFELQSIMANLNPIEIEPGVIYVTNKMPLSWHWLVYYDAQGNVYKCIGDKSCAPLKSFC